jgi:hypothetical protein
VEAEELKGEKEPTHYVATGIFQREIVRPHPLRAQLGILMTALIVVVAGNGASRISNGFCLMAHYACSSRK